MDIYECPECGKGIKFYSNERLEADGWPWRIHRGELRIVCPDCAKNLPKPEQIGRAYSWGT
jgi:endogenous inhibitor of DNA gyrase (YacG/DUF329 family)